MCQHLINFLNNQASQNQSINTSYQTTSSFHSKKKRIYSAKPALQDSRRFTRGTQRQIQDSSILELSPSEKKIPESNFIRFSQQTAPSTDFHRSCYNPYQTMTKMSDNFLNIERKTMRQNFFNNETTARSSGSNLSNFTHVQNDRTEDQLVALDKIREMHSEVAQLSSLKHVDCGKLLISANQKMKRINYKLNNIVSNGELHVELHRNDPKEVEIFDDIPFLFKVGCKGLLGPAKFILKFKVKGKVKSYVSLDKSLGTNPKNNK